MTKTVLCALVCVCVFVVVKQFKPEMATIVAVASGVALTIVVCQQLFDVVYSFYNLSSLAGVDSQAVTCIVKVVGIGYLGEFTNSICVDSNCKSIGEKVLLATKLAIVLCALPIVEGLFSTLFGVLA